jgi:Trypsin
MKIDCGGVFLDGIFLGGTSIDGSNSRLRVSVAKEVPHPLYSKDTTSNDIMLVKLSDRVTTLPFQSLSERNSEPEIGSIVTAVRVTADTSTLTDLRTCRWDTALRLMTEMRPSSFKRLISTSLSSARAI